MTLLLVHIAAGAAGLGLGPLVLLAETPGWHRHHARIAGAYQAALAVLCVTAIGLTALAWHRLWWFALLAVATEAAAVGGWWVRRRRADGWLPRHVRLMGGSYVSLVTALAVVSWGGPLSWVLPPLLGSTLIEMATVRAGRSPTMA